MSNFIELYARNATKFDRVIFDDITYVEKHEIHLISKLKGKEVDRIILKKSYGFGEYLACQFLDRNILNDNGWDKVKSEVEEIQLKMKRLMEFIETQRIKTMEESVDSDIILEKDNAPKNRPE